MSESKAVISSPGVSEADQLDRAEYQSLETALLQTARGRNFLTEYLRRNGGDSVGAHTMMVEEGLAGPQSGNDTDRILQAVENLHNAVVNNQQQNTSADHARMDILEMAKAIAKTRSEISAMRTDGDYDHLTVASEEMDAIVLSTEKATNDILQAAEKIQEVAWRLRETGTDEASCEEIDNNATDIYMACSFQDITGQRTTKVVRVLQYLEARINSMIEIWGLSEEEIDRVERAPATGIALVPAVGGDDERPDAHLLNGPQAQEAALGQDNIDALLGDGAFAKAGNDDEPFATSTSPEIESADGQELSSQDAVDDVFAEAPNDEIIDEEKLKALFS